MNVTDITRKHTYYTRQYVIPTIKLTIKYSNSYVNIDMANWGVRIHCNLKQNERGDQEILHKSDF